MSPRTAFSDKSLSAGNICALICLDRSGCLPASSQKFHSPMNSSRAFREHSKTCPDVQNSGLIDLILAIPSPLPLHHVPRHG